MRSSRPAVASTESVSYIRFNPKTWVDRKGLFMGYKAGHCFRAVILTSIRQLSILRPDCSHFAAPYYPPCTGRASIHRKMFRTVTRIVRFRWLVVSMFVLYGTVFPLHPPGPDTCTIAMLHLRCAAHTNLYDRTSAACEHIHSTCET